MLQAKEFLPNTSKNMLRYRKRTKNLLVKVAIYFILITLAFVVLSPFLQVVGRSLKTAAALMTVTVNGIPHSPQLFDNYSRAAEALQYGKFLLNSLFLTILPTIGAVLSASLVGYGFARYNFKGRGILFMLVLLTLIVPPQAVIIPLYELYNTFGWLNPQQPYLSWLPLIVPSFFANGLKGGLFVFIFRQTFRGIPKELEEAARLDGCGMLRSYLLVAMPLSGPAILVSSILSIVWQWNNYFEPQVFLTLDTMWPLTMRLADIYTYYFQSAQDAFSTYNIAIVAAASVLVMIPMVVFYALVQRLFIKGVERTGLVE